jgi:hypothetical protein
MGYAARGNGRSRGWRISIRDTKGKTELVIQHEGFPTKDGCDQHCLGWSSNNDCLEEFLQGILKSHARA